ADAASLRQRVCAVHVRQGQSGSGARRLSRWTATSWTRPVLRPARRLIIQLMQRRGGLAPPVFYAAARPSLSALAPTASLDVQRVNVTFQRRPPRRLAIPRRS